MNWGKLKHLSLKEDPLSNAINAQKLFRILKASDSKMHHRTENNGLMLSAFRKFHRPFLKTHTHNVVKDLNEEDSS